MDTFSPAESTGTEHIAPPTGYPRRYFRWLSHWRDLLAVTRALRELVDAQLPLAPGLLQLSQDAPRRSLRFSFYGLHRELMGGRPLWEGMEYQPELYPPFYVALVKSGDESGQLPEALADLEAELEEQIAFRRRAASINTYLSVTLACQLLVAVGVLTYVMPQLIRITNALGGSLSPLMEWLNLLHTSGITLFLLVGALAFPIFWIALEFSHLRGGNLSRGWAHAIQWLPLIGPAQRRGNLAGASAILGRLLRAGMPLPAALRMAAETASPPVCRDPLRRIASAVERGEELRDALNQEWRVFPSSFRTLAALGESSGQLPEALHQISVLYRTQSLHHVRMALELGAPLLIVLNGGLVFLIYGGFFLTIFSNANLIH